MEIGISISHYAIKQWYPNSSRDENRVSVVWHRTVKGCYGELDNYFKKKFFLSKFKQNDPEYVIIECVFINFKHTREIKIFITNEHTLLLLLLNEDLFHACFVYLTLSQKILSLKSNIKYLIYF